MCLKIKNNKLATGLIVAVILLTIITIIFVVLFVVNKTKSGQQSDKKPADPESEEEFAAGMCHEGVTDICISRRYNMKEKMQQFILELVINYFPPEKDNQNLEAMAHIWMILNDKYPRAFWSLAMIDTESLYEFPDKSRIEIKVADKVLFIFDAR